MPTPAQRREGKVDQGLLVQRVQGAAARAEIVPGDVALAMVVAGRHVKLDTLDAYNHVLGELRPGQQVSVLIRRADFVSYVSLRAEK